MTEVDYAFEREDGGDLVVDNKKKSTNPDAPVYKPKVTTNVGMNLNCDPGMMLVEDSSNFEDISAKEFSKRTADNLCTLYKQLFDIKKSQDVKHGPDGEILEYVKSKWTVEMPAAHQVLPREKPCPAEKSMTKWEKFRDERGMAPRARRSRLVFDPISNDWVPRWGPNSVKKIEDKHQWLLPEEGKHRKAGVDPFTYARAEKKSAMEKQDLAQVRN